MRWLAQVFFAFFLTLTLALPAAAAKKRSKKKHDPSKEAPTSGNYVNPAISDEALVAEMMKHLGVQYRRGGSSPGGVDCSGFVGLVYRNAYGMDLPHQSGSLYVSSSLQKIQMDDLQTGDLLFFTSSRKGKKINHVGIYLSDREFVHAASGKGVGVSSLDERYWNERIAGARRVPDRPNRGSKGAADPSFEFAALSNRMEASLLGLETTLDDGEFSPAVRPGNLFGFDSGRDLTFNLSFFQDTLFSLNRPIGDTIFKDVMPVGQSLSAYMQGVRLEKPIRPNDWMVVTPSFAYFNYEGQLDETGLPRRSLGLDVAFGSAKDGWSVSTGFKYLSLIPAKGISAVDERMPDTFNMSLTYKTQISDSMSLSLIGERLQRYDTPAADMPQQQDKLLDDQRFSILFNFRY